MNWSNGVEFKRRPVPLIQKSKIVTIGSSAKEVKPTAPSTGAASIHRTGTIVGSSNEGSNIAQAGAKPADVYLHNPRGGNVADNRVESKIADRSKLSKQARQKLLETSSASAGKQLAETSGTQSNRTPPVVARRPVSTAGLNPGGIRETPDQRLANPKFVPQASNRKTPVVSGHPVSAVGLGQGTTHTSPDQRLANPKFVPQASNRGRSEPAQPAR
jgi:hypothetical protein